MDIPIYTKMNFGNTTDLFHNGRICDIMSDAENPWENKLKVCKAYVRQYFIKCNRPVVTLFWKPNDKTVLMYTKQELSQILINQKFSSKIYNADGKLIHFQYWIGFGVQILIMQMW